MKVVGYMGWSDIMDPGRQFYFKTICGFLSCDEGTVSVNGKVMGKDKDMLTEAGIIIEEPRLLWKIHQS